jgi:hypothetical protein
MHICAEQVSISYSLPVSTCSLILFSGLFAFCHACPCIQSAYRQWLQAKQASALYEQDKERYSFLGMTKIHALEVVGYKPCTLTQHSFLFEGAQSCPQLHEWLTLGGSWERVGLEDLKAPTTLVQVKAAVEAFQMRRRNKKSQKRKHRRNSESDEDRQRRRRH